MKNLSPGVAMLMVTLLMAAGCDTEILFATVVPAVVSPRRIRPNGVKSFCWQPFLQETH